MAGLAVLALLGAGVFSDEAWAYPEMVRHGYVNCTACHVSPSGGGILTTYGRELSREVLSIWGREGESEFAYGALKAPEWLQLGGDIRTVEIYRDNAVARMARFIPMQADLEAAISTEKWGAAATLGLSRKLEGTGYTLEGISRRHYVMYRPTETWSVRAGKFFTAFGIQLPDHFASTRAGIDIAEQGTESYNIESAYLGEAFSVHATAILGRINESRALSETGVALRGSYSFFERYQVGLSLLRGSTTEKTRTLSGPFAVLGITPKLVLVSELDLEWSKTLGAVSYQKLSYEFVQGLHGYLTFDWMRGDFSDTRSARHSYGAGVQVFPRPHFELNLSWQRQRVGGQTGEDDFAWFLFHFYL